MSLSCFSSSRKSLQLFRFRSSAAVISPGNIYLPSGNNKNNNNKNKNNSGSSVTNRYYETSSAANIKAIDIMKPTIDDAKLMPVGMAQMSNETLVTIATLGDHDAGCEVLRRHIMAKDEVDYDEACKIFDKIAKENRGFTNLAVYPYFIGIGAGMIGAFGALPMVFDLNTALWFNQDYVTTDIPEPRDLETIMEVGSWTWNWMEPPLGTFSFALLCLQFAR
jgi:hypothetical protein